MQNFCESVVMKNAACAVYLYTLYCGCLHLQTAIFKYYKKGVTIQHIYPSIWVKEVF